MSAVAVVGAGITGLTAAVHRLGAGHDVFVFEADRRAGGSVATEHRDGFVVECGPQAIHGGSAAVATLLDRLGLRDRIVPAQRAASRRFLLHHGELVPLPSWPPSLRDGFGLLRGGALAPFAALRVLCEPFVPVGGEADETVEAFMRRRIGRGAAEALVDPMIGGIFAGDPGRLEMASAMPRAWRYEKDEGSLVFGVLRASSVAPTGAFTFPRGLGELIDALTAAVGASLRLGERVERIEPLRGRAFRVHTSLRAVDVDEVVITAAPEVAARWFPIAPPPLPRAPVVGVHLGYRDEDVPPTPPGFGWLVHSRQRKDVLGCLWVSDAFPGHAPSGHRLYRVLAGGVRDPQVSLLPDGVLVARARDVLAETQGISAEPVVVHVSRALPGIPQYPQGYQRWLASLHGVHGVRFVGWSYGGVGVADGIAMALA